MPKSTESPVEPFKRALAHAARSLAETADLEIVYSTEPPHLAGKRAVLPHPPQSLPYREAEPEGFVLSVNRLDRAKRIDLLIEAVKRDPSLRAVITGQGPDRARRPLQRVGQRPGISGHRRKLAQNAHRLVREQAKDLAREAGVAERALVEMIEVNGREARGR